MPTPNDLDWGVATVELASDEHRVGVHVFNHSLESPMAVARSIRFARARAAWFQKQLPPDFTQWAVFDDRGQTVSLQVRREIQCALSTSFQRVAFYTEGLPNPGEG